LNKAVLERFIYAGARVSYSAYNAFLQGQFRQSDHTINRRDMLPAAAEVWAGLNAEINERWRIDTFVRARTKDVDLAESTVPVWGGVVFSRSSR